MNVQTERRKFRRLVRAGWLVVLLPLIPVPAILSQTPSGGRTDVTAVIHARLIDGTGSPARQDTTILIEGHTIKAIGAGTSIAIPNGARILDAKGETVMPGLADMHLHLVGGWDGVSTDILGYQNYLNSLLYSGVTTVLDTGNIPPLIFQLRAAVASGAVLGPRIYAVGPLVDGADPAWPPLSVSIVSKYQVPNLVAQLKSEKADLIKLYVGLSDPLVKAISDEAKKQNLRTIIDQWRRNGSTDLMDDDIAGFAHLPFHRISDEAVQHAKDKGIFFISTLVVQETMTRRRFRDPSFLDDPLIADVTPPSQLDALRATAGKPPGPAELATAKSVALNFEGAESNVTRLWNAGVLIAAGTDACYPGDFQGEGLHRELELLVESGLTPLQAITAATKNAAAIVNASQEWGTLEPGKLANLLFINGKPDQHIHDTHNITLLMMRGVIIDRNKLKFTSKSKDFAPVGGISAE